MGAGSRSAGRARWDVCSRTCAGVRGAAVALLASLALLAACHDGLPSAPSRTPAVEQVEQPGAAATEQPTERSAALRSAESEAQPVAGQRPRVRAEPEGESQAFRLTRDAAVRKRPGLEWPILADLAAGSVIEPLAITPGLDPWLRIRIGGGLTGWLRLAVTGAARQSLIGVPLESARPIRAWVGSGDLWLGPGAWARAIASLGFSEPQAVVGRSADGGWVAMSISASEPSLVWAPADQVQLMTSDLTLRDLPILAGTGTTLLPLDEQDARAARIAPVAPVWDWLPDGALVGVDQDGVWRYDPNTGELRMLWAEGPLSLMCVGNAAIAPDGGHVAVDSYSPNERENPLGGPRDVTLIPLDGSEPMEFERVSWPIWPGHHTAVGHWSPDGRWLLVNYQEVEPGWNTVAEEDREPRRFYALSIAGERFELPLESTQPRWLADSTLAYTDPDGVPRAFDPDSRRLVEPRAPVVGMGERGRPEGVSDQAWWRRRWSPDGRYAVFAPNGGALLLYDSVIDSLRELDFIPPPGIANAGWHWDIFWSPAGGRFVVAIGGWEILQAADTPVWLVEVDALAATNVKLLGELVGSDIGASIFWSPDGNAFWIHARGSLGEESWWRDGLAAVVNSDGGFEITQLQRFDRRGRLTAALRTQGRDLIPRWSPDGRWLALGGTSWDGCQ